MTKRVQLIGHEAEEANAFIGEEREITVDTDNDELRLHDGATAGGHKLLNRDQGDARWQARSDELDGFLDWEPSERGILTRLGPSNYVLRELEVDEASLVVANPNGFAGNPSFSLASEITSDHTFTGATVYSQPITANGGVMGNVTGDTAGTHTGPVVGDVTGDVTGNLTGDSTGTHTGNLDTSDGGVLMADEQILLAWLEPAIIQLIINSGLPVGSVVAYSGDIDDLPDNWYVCDGTNATPDLRDRFIVGTGPTYPVDTTGGAATHTHGITVENGGEHTHTGSSSAHALTVAELPAHKHGNGVCDNITTLFNHGNLGASPTTAQAIESNGDTGSYEGYTTEVGSGDAHSHSLSIDNGGTHNHTASAASSSSLPPYYSLVYIMKGA